MSWLNRNIKRMRQMVIDPMSSGPALALGRYTFGNNAGFKQNVYGGLELWNARRNSPFDGRVCADPTAHAIDKIGFAKAPWRFPDELVAQLSIRFEAAIGKGFANEQRNENGDLINLSLENPLVHVPEIRMLMNERVRDVVHSYFGAHVRMYTPDYWRNFHVDESVLLARERFSERWHNDSGKVSVLSLLILITDVTEQHGATWCVARDTTREIFRNGLEYRKHNGAVSKTVENNARSVRFTGKRGEAWFLNTRRTLHRAGIPARGLHRDILGLKFTPIAGDQDIWDETPQPEEKTLYWHRY